MTLHILTTLDRIRTSFWFLPLGMAGGAILLATGMVALDEIAVDTWVRDWGWAYQGGAEGASAVLETIAGSMITIAGLVFSMTLVALTLTSSQFGPRLLRNFMRDRGNQFVLGTFTATFLYCLMVLRTIRNVGDDSSTPHFSVTLGVILAIASLVVLIGFIHHISVSIQADEVVAQVNAELCAGIDRFFPFETPKEKKPVQQLPPAFDIEALPIPILEDGYLQFVDLDLIQKLAEASDAIIRLECRPGSYLIRGAPLARVWPGKSLDDKLITNVQGACVSGPKRTPVQDVEHSVSQLVEVAVRALSPGINDPFTAITCVDRLGSALARLARRAPAQAFHHDSDGRLRVVTDPITFDGITDAALNQIRQYAQGSAAVTIRLLESIAAVIPTTCRHADRETLARHAAMVHRSGMEHLGEQLDRQVVKDRYDHIDQLLRDGALPE